MSRVVLASLLTLGITGCNPNKGECDTADPTDTDCPQETVILEDTWEWTPTDPEIDAITYSYETKNGPMWSYAVSLGGWAGLVVLDIHSDEVDGTSKDESHVLANVDFDRQGTYDMWAITLPVVSTEASQEDSVNTWFEATVGQRELMTWMLTVYGLEITTQDLAAKATSEDCEIWGDNPEDPKGKFAEYDCFINYDL